MLRAAEYLLNKHRARKKNSTIGGMNKGYDMNLSTRPIVSQLFIWLFLLGVPNLFVIIYKTVLVAHKVMKAIYNKYKWNKQTYAELV